MQPRWRGATLMLLFLGCTRDNPLFSLSSDTPLGDDAGVTGTAMTDDGSGSTTKTSGSADAGSGPSNTDDTAGDETQGTDATGSLDSTSTTGSSTGKRVFVTSQRYAADELGGLDGADSICQELASAAGLQGTFRAWLSDHTGSPADRMSKSGPYVLLDERPVADDWAELVSGTLQNPIDRDEHGEPTRDRHMVCAGSEVWTNTLADGTPRSNLHCDSWSSTQGVSFIGEYTQSHAAWTESGCINVSCVAALALYCFEQ